MPFWAQQFFSFNSVKKYKTTSKSAFLFKRYEIWKECVVKSNYFGSHDTLLPLLVQKFVTTSFFIFEDGIKFVIPLQTIWPLKISSILKQWKWSSRDWVWHDQSSQTSKNFRIRLKFRAKIFSYRKLKIKELSLCNKFEIYLNCSIRALWLDCRLFIQLKCIWIILMHWDTIEIVILWYV